MTRTFAAYTRCADSEEAGSDLGRQISDALTPDSPDAVVVFASSRFDYIRLLTALSDACRPGLLVGSSSAGEFTGQHRGEGTACALAITSTDIRFAAGLGQDVSRRPSQAAAAAIAPFRGVGDTSLPYRSALVMTDALAGHADELVRELTVLTSGAYQFAGGGAGDDANFSSTHVFYGTRAYTDAVVALELCSLKPLGIGVGHGWTPASRPLRVTEVDGTRVVSLNGFPAIEAFEAHAAATGQTIDRSAPLPFFLHNILGIDSGAAFQLRVPLAVNADGSITCAAEIPAGGRVHIMQATPDSAITAAQRATRAAVDALRGHPPAAALFFDCVATRLRMGSDFGFELQTVSETLGEARLVGCNTYGQIARAEGQFGGFHNCTAVVMVLPA
jgi:hypothetical protein